MATSRIVEFTSADMWHGSDGHMLVLRVPFQTQARMAMEEMKPGKTYVAEIKEKKEKRSLNANAYMWVLLEKLAIKLETTKVELYRKFIGEVGVFKDFPPLPVAEANTLMCAWREIGTGWIAEIHDYAPNGEDIIVRCYYGSSKYNTKQMSRLINSIVEECKEQDIETMSPAELAGLIDRWEVK